MPTLRANIFSHCILLANWFKLASFWRLGRLPGRRSLWWPAKRFASFLSPASFHLLYEYACRACVLVCVCVCGCASVWVDTKAVAWFPAFMLRRWLLNAFPPDLPKGRKFSFWNWNSSGPFPSGAFWGTFMGRLSDTFFCASSFGVINSNYHIKRQSVLIFNYKFFPCAPVQYPCVSSAVCGGLLEKFCRYSGHHGVCVCAPNLCDPLRLALMMSKCLQILSAKCV